MKRTETAGFVQKFVHLVSVDFTNSNNIEDSIELKM